MSCPEWSIQRKLFNFYNYYEIVRFCTHHRFFLHQLMAVTTRASRGARTTDLRAPCISVRILSISPSVEERKSKVDVS